MKLHRQINRGGGIGIGDTGRIFSTREETPDTSYATPEWVFQSACADSEVDMTADTNSPKVLDAQRAVCMRCPVAFECLKEVIELDNYAIAGVRAGLTNADWRRYKKTGTLSVEDKFARRRWDDDGKVLDRVEHGK